MPELLSLLMGALVTVMSIANAQLNNLFGETVSVALIHFIGLIIILPFGIRRFRFDLSLPLWYWAGGIVGIITILFSNIAYSALAVTIATAAQLSGQTATSLFFDHIGFLGSKKQPFNRRRVISLVFILAGTGVMALWQ